MLTPFAPHTTEELWEVLREKEMISIQKWPEADESKINLKVEAAEKFISQVIKDIEEIKKLSEIETPAKTTIFTTTHLKYELYNLVLEGIELKEIMQKKDFKKIGKPVSNYYNKLQKKKPLEELFLTAGYEYETLTKEKESLEKELKCKIEIIKAENSKHPKALAAEPGKPGILVE
jgi:leucyl-tRNA synthetase